MSVCISKNLRCLKKEVKRVLRYDTRPVSRLYKFQMWLQCWRYHYYLLIWHFLSNYEVRYYVHILNPIETMFSVNTAKNIRTFTQSAGGEIFHKRTVCADPWRFTRKSCGKYPPMENLHPRKSEEIPTFYAVEIRLLLSTCVFYLAQV